MLPTAPTCHPSFKFKNRVFIWCLIIFILIVAFIPHVTTCPNLHLNLKTVSLFGALSSSSSLWPSFLTTCPNLDYSHHHLSTPRLNLMCLYLLFYLLHLRCLVFFFSVQSSEVTFFFSSLHSLFISLCKVHVKILFYIIKVRKKNI